MTCYVLLLLLKFLRIPWHSWMIMIRCSCMHIGVFFFIKPYVMSFYQDVVWTLMTDID